MESAWAIADGPWADVGRYQGYIPAAAAHAVAAEGLVSIISIQYNIAISSLSTLNVITH